MLYLGSLTKTKGIFDLLRAMSLVRAHRTDAKLVVAGEWWRTEESEAAATIIREKHLTDVIEFIGPVAGDAKWQCLRQADLFVFPSHTKVEAFGLVLLEAMQAGLPIVTTRGGARDEILVEGVNTLLCHDQDPSDLGEKLLQLTSNAALRKQMGMANRKRFDEYFTHEQYGRRMIEALDVFLRDKQETDTVNRDQSQCDTANRDW